MKKAIIIVVIISICIVGGFILFQKLTEKGLESLNTERERVEAEKSKTKANIVDIAMKIALLDIGTLIDEWYHAGNTSRFETNSNNLAKVDDIIQSLKRKENIEAEYYIHTTVKNTVVKLRIISANSFYCLDTIQKSEQIVSTDNVEFKSPTTCAGQTLP